MIDATVETERLILRPPEARDLPAVEAYNASERARFTGGPRTPGDSFRAFAQVVGHWHFKGFGMFAIELRNGDGIACGLAGPWMPTDWPEGEIGWNLWSADLEGRGIAFEAARATREWVYKTKGWTTAVSYIDPQNTRSVALAQRLGARRDQHAPHPFGTSADIHVFRHPGPEAIS